MSPLHDRVDPDANPHECTKPCGPGICTCPPCNCEEICQPRIDRARRRLLVPRPGRPTQLVIVEALDTADASQDLAA